MPYAHDGSSGGSTSRGGSKTSRKKRGSSSRTGRRSTRPKNPTSGGTTPTYNGGSSYGGAAPSSSSYTSTQKSAADLQAEYLAAQRRQQQEAERKAAAEKRAAEVKQAKKERAESIRQNKVTRQQADAQFRLLQRFGRRRRLQLGNIDKALRTADSALLKSYKATSGQLAGARSDNEKAEASASFANTTNLQRESSDLQTQTAAVGAGESDTLRTQLQAIRNWDANQQEVGRSFFDTLRTVNSSITDLNNDTRTSRINLRQEANTDREQIWSNYYDRMADTWTTIYNIEGSNPNLGARNTAEKGSAEYENPIQAYERKYRLAHRNAARAAGSGYRAPAISKALQNWQGSVRAEGARLASSNLAAVVRPPRMKRPEGATLRYVDPPREDPTTVTPLPGPQLPGKPWGPGIPITGPKPVRPLPGKPVPVTRPRPDERPTPKPAPDLSRPGSRAPKLPGPVIGKPSGPRVTMPGGPRVLAAWEEES